MEMDSLTKALYQENLKWVYSVIKDLDSKGIEKKEKFINDPYIFNEIIVVGYYFMNLYIVSNISEYKEDDKNKILKAVLNGASNYNKEKLSSLYKKDIDLSRLIDQYNSVVKKTKTYSPDDGLKARVIAVDEVYRRIYPTFNKHHFNDLIKVFLVSFNDYERQIDKTIKENL